jgi:hypothetical protein
MVNMFSLLPLLLLFCSGISVGSPYLAISTVGLAFVTLIAGVTRFGATVVVPRGYSFFFISFFLILTGSIYIQQVSLSAVVAYFLILVITPLAMANFWVRCSIEDCAHVLVTATLIIGLISLMDYAFGVVDWLVSYTSLSRLNLANAAWSGIPRLYSVSIEPTNLALDLSVMLPVQLWWWKYRASNFWVALSICLPSWLALALTLSLMGYLSVALALGILVLARVVRIRFKFIPVVVATLGLLIWLALHFEGKSRIISDALYAKLTFTDDSALDRLTRWHAYLSQLLKAPLVGNGGGSEIAKIGGSATNWYLYYCYQFGVPALLAAVVGLIGPFTMSRVKHVTCKNAQDRDWNLVCATSWLICLFYLFSNSVIYDFIIWTVFGMFYAGRERRYSKVEEREPAPKNAAAAHLI